MEEQMERDHSTLNRGDKKTNWKDITVKTAETPNFVSSAKKNFPTVQVPHPLVNGNGDSSYSESKTRASSEPTVPYRPDQQHSRIYGIRH
jgi:hypothetical protein